MVEQKILNFKCQMYLTDLEISTLLKKLYGMAASHVAIFLFVLLRMVQICWKD